MTALPVMPAVADDFTPASADPLLAAQAQAVSTGQAVPVGTLTTEVSTTEALPDGTFVNTTSVLPARVLKDGAWIPVDATLVADDHGGYSPKTTPNGVTLSGGGDGPLVTLTHADGPSMALTLPFTLPHRPSAATPRCTPRYCPESTCRRLSPTRAASATSSSSTTRTLRPTPS
ncbi:hypothetical protein E4K10_45705 [Streptomyces sp. T1317-0309]|nr:hypothetical protein E4K10_45705 [Streptomyces sp. T1317-0309]